MMMMMMIMMTTTTTVGETGVGCYIFYVDEFLI